jgi:hypothetical protein
MMKSRPILCLALVLSGGLLGCSKIDQKAGKLNDAVNSIKIIEVSSTGIYTNFPTDRVSAERSFEERLNTMPPEKRRAAVKELVMLGFAVNLPEVLSDVDDPAAKVLFLKHLPEPFSNPMLDEISKVAPGETNSELKFLYGVFLYRYNHNGGLETLESVLARGNHLERKEAALILALNREDSGAVLVVKTLEQETNLDIVGPDELPAALGKWHNPAVQDFLKKSFQRQNSDAFLALGVGLGDQEEFLPRIRQMFRRRRAGNYEKVVIAAALSRLSPDKDDNQGINFLIDRLHNPPVQPPPQPDGSSVMVSVDTTDVAEALGNCGSVRAETILRGLVETNAAPKWHVVNASSMLAGKAAVALSDRLTPENLDVLIRYLKTANPQDFSEEDRTRFVCNMLNAGTPELKLAMTNLVSTNIIAVAGTVKFKQIPSAILPSLYGMEN